MPSQDTRTDAEAAETRERRLVAELEALKGNARPRVEGAATQPGGAGGLWRTQGWTTE